jgi:hypothetical protein
MKISDYSDFQNSTPKGNILAELRKAAQEYLDAEVSVEQLKASLERAEALRDHFQQKVIPDLMERAETSLWKSENGGITIEVERQLFCNISEERREGAHDWLEKNGCGSIIKREFKINFGKGDEAWARKFQRDLAQRKRPLNSKVKMSVHPQTLQKTLRELLQDGVVVPLEQFGAFFKRVAKVKVDTETGH